MRRGRRAVAQVYKLVKKAVNYKEHLETALVLTDMKTYGDVFLQVMYKVCSQGRQLPPEYHIPEPGRCTQASTAILCLNAPQIYELVAVGGAVLWTITRDFIFFRSTTNLLRRTSRQQQKFKCCQSSHSLHLIYIQSFKLVTKDLVLSQLSRFSVQWQA